MSDEKWTFDKRVPLALVATLFLQTGAAVWWASSIERRVTEAESRIAEAAVKVLQDREFHTDQRIRLWNRMNENEGVQQQTDKVLANVSGILSEMSKRLDRIDTKLDKAK